MDSRYELSYGINERLLRCVGIWPFQRKIHAYSTVFALVLVAGSQLGCKINILMSSWSDMDIVIECVPPLIVDLSCVVKLINWIVNRHKMKSLIERIRDTWQSPMTENEMAILESYAEDGRKFTILWIYYIYSIVVTFIGLPLLPQIIGNVSSRNVSSSKELPTPVKYYHVNTDDHYYPILLHASVTAGMFCTVLIASDTMFVVFVQHACGLFAVLAFAELIDSAHATSFILVMGLNMVIISFSGVQILSDAATPHLLVRQSSMILGQMFHLYVDNVYSQKLMDHSLSLRSTIWSSHWYRASVKTKRLLNLVTMRASRPCLLTAGSLCVMSMENFGWVLKTSSSYFTMLRSLQ